MNLIICLLENMIGNLDAELPSLIETLTYELTFADGNRETISYTKYKCMILQALSMCFNYNSQLTFQILESQGKTLGIFQSWFVFMNDFKKDFEIRRILLGLTAIIMCPTLPGLVSEKLPDVMNQVSLLSCKMNSERLKCLKENEQHVAKDGKEGRGSESWIFYTFLLKTKANIQEPFLGNP